MFLFRIIELILYNQLNPLFELRICSDQSHITELTNYSNRYYHLEEIIPDEIDQNKDMVLIPVAHYIKVRNFKFHLKILFFFIGKFNPNKSSKIFSIFSQCDTCKKQSKF